MAWPIRRPAARLGRLAGGRPGLALAYARAPAAVLIRAELTRVLLDLTDARPSARLAAARAAIPRAIALAAALGAGDAGPRQHDRRAGEGRRRRGHDGSGFRPAPGAARPTTTPTRPTDEEAGPARIPAVERRRGVEILLGLWADVARDLALVGSGGARSVHDTVLLDELSAISAAIPPGSAGAFLARAARSAELLAGNVSPELVLDALVLSWPSRSAAA